MQSIAVQTVNWFFDLNKNHKTQVSGVFFGANQVGRRYVKILNVN